MAAKQVSTMAKFFPVEVSEPYLASDNAAGWLERWQSSPPN
jgi:hypothetical protein